MAFFGKNNAFLAPIFSDIRAGRAHMMNFFYESFEKAVQEDLLRTSRGDRDLAANHTSDFFLSVRRTLMLGGEEVRDPAGWLNRSLKNRRILIGRSMARPPVTKFAGLGGEELGKDPAHRARRPPRISSSTTDTGDKRLILEKVTRVLLGLPEKYRRLLLLRSGGCSYEEIAAREDLSPGTVKMRIHHGRKMLLERIGGSIDV